MVLLLEKEGLSTQENHTKEYHAKGRRQWYALGSTAHPVSIPLASPASYQMQYPPSITKSCPVM